MQLLDVIETRTRVILSVAVLAAAAAAILRLLGAPSVAVFVASAVALAGLAALVGEATDQLGQRLGAGATGVLQSALGNLPELFISIFALQAGLVGVVKGALIGSILANALLVLGLAFFFGGLRNGPQRFGAGQTRMMATLLVLAIGAIAIPTLATEPGAPDAGHATELSLVVSIVLLVVFGASIPSSIRSRAVGDSQPMPSSATAVGALGPGAERTWPLALALVMLAIAGIGAAVVSDWFVESLRPAMAALAMSEEFVGLVVVAIAGNAVENVVGIQTAMRNEADLAISLIVNSALQVALALVPVLVILSLWVGPTPLTLVVSPLLIAALAFGGILTALVVNDGESTWLEGLALVGLYAIIAASVWWGPPIGG